MSVAIVRFSNLFEICKDSQFQWIGHNPDNAGFPQGGSIGGTMEESYAMVSNMDVELLDILHC